MLAAVTALSPSEAWAVGATYSGEGSGDLATLIEHWDGSTWRIVASPGSGYLNGVAAVSSREVWAVGEVINAQGVEYRAAPLVVRWDGTRWRVIPSPNPSQTTSSLSSVTTLEANEVWTVGAYSPTIGVSLPLIERWDGATWRVVTSPDLPGVTESRLDAITRIPRTRQLWAVGYALKGPRPAYEQALIERWDGVAWKIVANPTLPSGAYGSQLKGIVALSATDAWATGEYTASDHTVRPLITHWDGTSWTIAFSPDEWGRLAGVAAIGARDVRVVGAVVRDHLTPGSGIGPLPWIGIVAQWDGSSWRVVESPALAAPNSDLIAIAADGAGGYWAVGPYFYTTFYLQTIIARCS